jgi:hypothetical protein
MAACQKQAAFSFMMMPKKQAEKFIQNYYKI